MISIEYNTNKMSVKISILMPIYNGVEFFEESLNSILEQTYEHWELIIGVNGHPANSSVYRTVLEKMKQDINQKIKVYDFPELKGKANTLNEMKNYCDKDSSYVAILDVDDLWHPEKLRIQSPFLDKYDVIGTKCVYFGEMEGVIPNIPVGDISSLDFFSGNPIINSSSLIRKEFAWWSDQFLGLDDYYLWLQLRKEGNTFFNCQELVLKHRIHKQYAFNAKGNHHRVKDLLLYFMPTLGRK
jgi:glycosyltransferase involved in cell wall biosynthesis